MVLVHIAVLHDKAANVTNAQILHVFMQWQCIARHCKKGQHHMVSPSNCIGDSYVLGRKQVMQILS